MSDRETSKEMSGDQINGKDDVSRQEQESHSDSDSDSGSSDDSNDDEIALKLNEQLLEDIRRAREAAISASEQDSRPNTAKEEAALATMKTVLALVEADTHAQSTLSSTFIPETSEGNVLDIISKCVSDGRISRQVAGPLSQVLVALAKSDVLFLPLPTVKATASKRKRDDKDATPKPKAKAKKTAKSGGKSRS